MKAITLRDIPGPVAKRINDLSKLTGASLNKTVIALLSEDIARRSETHQHDLDHLFGIWTEEDAAEFDRNLNEQRAIEPLLDRITINPAIFGGKPIIRGRRMAVEHLLAMMEAGDNVETILDEFPWLELDDIRACLAYARRLVANERIESIRLEPAA